jgi:hypothetical protein
VSDKPTTMIEPGKRLAVFTMHNFSPEEFANAFDTCHARGFRFEVLGYDYQTGEFEFHLVPMAQELRIFAPADKQSIPGVPEGWEVVEFRQVCSGEYYMDDRGLVDIWDPGAKSSFIYPILRKIETKEPSE